MPEVVEALTALSEQATEKKDGETLSSSQSLCKELTTWRFILCVVIWYNVLYQTTAMARYFGDILIKHLEDLKKKDFKRFHSKLKDYKMKKTRIPWSRLERAGVDETVELLIQYFVNQAVPVAVEVLKRCNVNNVA
ncbi:NACHT, LRR and PYD domains-containing protein 6 [Acipenser ruthenus]|uniref:NACHT, LRR and PYD domains-containing protein 6 n=1 Tax=Acipenser ruthenus TaxID=7906 RepID=A0A444UVJ2_ACIRT|nr:NACHT, LRR and PYD domains-containing protein 6 [Acipenser ruthenus]